MPRKTPGIADILGERYAGLVHTPWSPALEEINACLKQLNLPQLQRHLLKETLHLWYLSRRYPKAYKFSLFAIADNVGITRCYCAEQMKLLALVKDQEGYIIQEHDSPLLVLTKPKNGIAYGVDPAPLLALPDTMARHKKRSHHAQRPALAALVASQPRPASAHVAPSMEQEQAGPIEAPAAPAPARIEADRPAAPALPEECSAVLVAFLDALPLHQKQENDLPDLVTFVQQQRRGLDDTGLWRALDRARDSIAADMQRSGERIARPVGLFKYKIENATRQVQQELEAAARRIAEQEQEEAALLAGPLSPLGEQFLAIGSTQGWPGFAYGRLYIGRQDWQLFARSNDAIIRAALARIEGANLADQGEQPSQPEKIEAPAAPAQEQEEAAPARIETSADLAPVASMEQPDQAGPLSIATSSPDLPAIKTARIGVLCPPRFWQLACDLQKPHIEILADDLETEIVLDGPDSWEDFRATSSANEQRRAEITLGKMGRGKIGSTGTRPAGRYRLPNVNEAPARSIEADQRPSKAIASAPAAPHMAMIEAPAPSMEQPAAPAETATKPERKLGDQSVLLAFLAQPSPSAQQAPASADQAETGRSVSKMIVRQAKKAGRWLNDSAAGIL